MKPEEEIIREEIRALREIILKLVQWSVTLLASMQAAILFLRREYLIYQVDGGLLAKGSALPLKAYLGGTVFLFALATMCMTILGYTRRQFTAYQMQLEVHRASAIQDPVAKAWERKTVRFVVSGMFFFFPLIDLVFRFVYVGFR